MQVPFERIDMDLIGPLERSARGHRFALVLVDYATRYPEAVALRNISAKSVAEALFSMISRVGIPKEILTDQGTAFMSRTIRELYGLSGIKSVRTSIYHPQTDGLVERFNRTLKTMIRKFGQNWDKWLEPLFVHSAGGPASLHRVFPLRAPVRPPAPQGFGRPEGDLGGGTFGEQEWNSACAGPENKTPHSGAALHGEFVTGLGQAKPAIQSGGQITQFHTGR